MSCNMFHVARHPDHIDFLFISSSTSLVRPDFSAFSTRSSGENTTRVWPFFLLC